MDDSSLLVFYTYENLHPHSIMVSKHMRSITLNMNMQYFHLPQVISGLLWSRLGIYATDELVNAILDYPEFPEGKKSVTRLF